MQESESLSGRSKGRIFLSLRVASEHVGIFRSSVTAPGLDAGMGQGRFSAELSEASLLFLGPEHSFLQFGMLWA